MRDGVRRLRRLAHGRDRDARPAGAGASCSACSPTTSRSSPVGGAQYSVLCREDGGVLDDLFTYRLGARPLPDGHQRRQPRQGPRLVPRARRAASTSRSPTRIDRYAMLAVQGPRAREIVQAIADAPLPARFTVARRARSRGARGARLRHGLHGRGRRRAAAATRPTRPRSGTRSSRRGAAPAGPGRARHAAPRGLLPPLRQRPDGGARPDRGRPGLVLQGGHRASSAPTPCAPSREAGPGREARRRSRSRAPGIAAPGQPGRRRRRGDQRHAVAVPGRRDRHGLRARRARRSRAPSSRSTSAARSARRRRGARKPLYRKENDG